MSTEHITWKTNAWKNPATVENYASRMNDSAGFNLMKNRIEPELYAKYAVGPAVLDVGIGTGRASLPLAKAGYDVTGVDSSEAMLRKARELSDAQGTKMTFTLGDVASLEFRDDVFDTVLALNTIAHFPHWKEIVSEWSRVTRPGGRLIFDMFSTDHDVAYGRAIGQTAQWGVKTFEPERVAEFYLRLPVDELVSSLSEMGLSIEAIVPYSVFLGAGGYNRFFTGSVVEGYSWDRLLSWISADRSLFDFLTFLEQEFIANLTSVAACRYAVILNKTKIPDQNRKWIEHNARYNADLAGGLSLSCMSKYSNIEAAGFKRKLNEFLRHAPNRAALIRILFANLLWNFPIALEEFVEEPYRSEIENVYARGRLESDVVRMLQGLSISPLTADALRYKGVPIGPTMEYEAVMQIFDKAYHAFGEAK